MNSKSMKLYGQKALQFVTNNKGLFLQLGVMAAVVAVMPDSVAYAQSGAADDTISVLTKPLSRMESLMSGPVPKAIVTIGAATGAASWALNIENQVTKTAMRVVGGGSVALGAAAFVSQTTGMVIM